MSAAKGCSLLGIAGTSRLVKVKTSARIGIAGRRSWRLPHLWPRRSWTTRARTSRAWVRPEMRPSSRRWWPSSSVSSESAEDAVQRVPSFGHLSAFRRYGALGPRKTIRGRGWRLWSTGWRKPTIGTGYPPALHDSGNSTPRVTPFAKLLTTASAFVGSADSSLRQTDTESSTRQEAFSTQYRVMAIFVLSGYAAPTRPAIHGTQKACLGLLDSKAANCSALASVWYLAFHSP